MRKPRLEFRIHQVVSEVRLGPSFQQLRRSPTCKIYRSFLFCTESAVSKERRALVDAREINTGSSNFSEVVPLCCLSGRWLFSSSQCRMIANFSSLQSTTICCSSQIFTSNIWRRRLSVSHLQELLYSLWKRSSIIQFLAMKVKSKSNHGQLKVETKAVTNVNELSFVIADNRIRSCSSYNYKRALMLSNSRTSIRLPEIFQRSRCNPVARAREKSMLDIYNSAAEVALPLNFSACLKSTTCLPLVCPFCISPTFIPCLYLRFRRFYYSYLFRHEWTFSSIELCMARHGQHPNLLRGYFWAAPAVRIYGIS